MAFGRAKNRPPIEAKYMKTKSSRVVVTREMVCQANDRLRMKGKAPAYCLCSKQSSRQVLPERSELVAMLNEEFKKSLSTTR